MRALIIIIFFAFAIHARAGESYSITSNVQSKEYKCEIAREQLLKTPVWSPKADFPPLSPRKAEEAATARFRKLLKDTKGWRCSDITLDHPFEDEHWIYIVLFAPSEPHIGADDSLQIIVLMDGNVVEPKVIDAK
jgi:hypothetical protein